MASIMSSQVDIYNSLRNAAKTTPITSLLQQPVETLLGVNSSAHTALQKFGITSIFDLASSVVFDNATKIVAAVTDPQSALYRYGKAPADVV